MNQPPLHPLFLRLSWLCLCFFPAVAWVLAAAPQRNPAVLTGTVYNSQRQPLPLADVYAYDGQTFAYAGLTQTDTTGRYTLTLANPPEIIKLYATRPGYFARWYRQQNSFFYATPISSTATSSTQYNFFLTQGAVIEGRVRYETGDDASPILVELFTDDLQFVAYQWTASGGEFAFGGLPAGVYKMRLSYHILPEWYNNQHSGETATPITVTLGEIVQINPRVSAGGQIAGVVQDEQTVAPIAGATVTAYRPDGSPAGGSLTNGLGQYQLVGLEEGIYLVGVARWPFYHTSYYSGSATLAEATPLTVTGDLPLENINFSLTPRPTSTITGQLTAEGQPLPAGAEITLYLYQAQPFAQVQQTTFAGDGLTTSYQLTNVPEGAYKLEFNTAQTPPWATQWYSASPNSAEAQVVTVTAGVTTSHINANLWPPLPNPLGCIEGTVRRAGVPLTSGVRVQAHRPGEAQYTQFTTELNTNGEYLLCDLPAGVYELSFAQWPWATIWAGNTPWRTQTTPITVTAGGSTSGVDGVLEEPGGCVVGQFLNQEGLPSATYYTILACPAGECTPPAVSAWVGRFGVSYQLQGQTDPAGAMAVCGLAAGWYHFSSPAHELEGSEGGMVEITAGETLLLGNPYLPLLYSYLPLIAKYSFPE